MQKTGIQVGREDHALAKRRAQRLGQDELVVDVLPDDPDRSYGVARIELCFLLQLNDQPPDVVALVPVLRPFELDFLAVLALAVSAGAGHEPLLLRDALEGDSVDAGEVGVDVELRFLVPPR